MFLMYVDESGDCGAVSKGSPTNFFILTGLIIHESKWNSVLNELVSFRKMIRGTFGFSMREEIHASKMLSHHDSKMIASLKRNDRLTILRLFIKQLATLNDIRIINIVVNKKKRDESYNIFEKSWQVIIQRFENTIINDNFVPKGFSNDMGMILHDHTDDKKLRLILRKMRKFNYIPHSKDFGEGSRNIQLKRIIEDPNPKKPELSYFIQGVDTIAYFVKQYYEPSKYCRKKSGHLYFERLNDILCKEASRANNYGIVEL